jgi:hypothetical protein
MTDRTSKLLVLLTFTAACEAVSRNVGDLQTEDGEEIDLVALATKMCESEQTCCVAPAKPGTAPDVEHCEPQRYTDFLSVAEDGAAEGLWADPACFERYAECNAPPIECERPCKMFYGTKGLGETCWGHPLGKDNCAQGLVCQTYTARIYDCDDPFGKCSEEATRCIDPCASATDVECRVGDVPDRCGPETYCDDVPLEDDYVDDTFGTCRPRPQIGESCASPGARCAAGSFCDRDAVGGPTCVPLLAEGVPCGDDLECASSRCGRSSGASPGDVCEPYLWWACRDGG